MLKVSNNNVNTGGLTKSNKLKLKDVTNNTPLKNPATTKKPTKSLLKKLVSKNLPKTTLKPPNDENDIEYMPPSTYNLKQTYVSPVEKIHHKALAKALVDARVYTNHGSKSWDDDGVNKFEWEIEGKFDQM